MVSSVIDGSYSYNHFKTKFCPIKYGSETKLEFDSYTYLT